METERMILKDGYKRVDNDSLSLLVTLSLSFIFILSLSLTLSFILSHSFSHYARSVDCGTSSNRFKARTSRPLHVYHLLYIMSHYKVHSMRNSFFNSFLFSILFFFNSFLFQLLRLHTVPAL